MKELRQLKQRVDALRELGEEALNSDEAQANATCEYAALKSHIEKRLKEVARMDRTGARPFRGFLLLGALRRGYLAMRASKRTSPRNSTWQSAVRMLQVEVDRHESLLKFETVDVSILIEDGGNS